MFYIHQENQTKYDMNIRIFISTDPDSLIGIIYKADSENNCKLESLLQEVSMADPQYLIKCKRYGLSDKIILLSDKFTDTSLSENSIRIDSNNDYLLYHSKTDENVKKLFAFSNRVSGLHSTNDEDLYKPVFDIILDDNLGNDNKLSKIIEILGAQKEKDLRLKTDFLYYVYNGGKPKEYSLGKDLSVEKYYKIFDITQYDKSIDMIEGSEKGEKQRENLIKLRDAILNR